MLMLARAGFAEMEPGDEFWFLAYCLAPIVILIVFVIVFALIAYKTIASLDSREQRRFRASKSLFEGERSDEHETAATSESTK